MEVYNVLYQQLSFVANTQTTEPVIAPSVEHAAAHIRNEHPLCKVLYVAKALEREIEWKVVYYPADSEEQSSLVVMAESMEDAEQMIEEWFPGCFVDHATPNQDL